MSEEIKYNGFTIEIKQDSDPMNPREDWDNFSTMVCAHKAYGLGDKNETVNRYADGWDDAILMYFADQAGVEYDDTYGHEREAAQVQRWIDKNVFILPLYLYDHSGITMNTSGFNCPWDSGQVGFIYTTREEARKWFGWKRITKAREAKIEKYLKSDVATYDQYLTGEIYGYIVNDEDGEEIDSCWGFFGYDHEKSGLLEQARDQIDWHINDQLKKKFEHVKIMIKNHVPLEYRA